MSDERRIREIVRRVVYRAVGRTPVPRAERERALVTESDLKDVEAGGRFEAPRGALITPLARQAAMERKVSLVEPGRTSPHPSDSQPSSGHRVAPPGRTVALGADHGGYTFKEMLKGHLRDQGYEVVDCGTEGTESVDYPDFALAVAQLVAEGRAWRGILVDGAGIGSCMAANKVPGVRAAMCYDKSTAFNSREHNDANVLTLGAGFLGESLARQIVQTWLASPFGAGRHARRVDKIMAIERRFTRQR